MWKMEIKELTMAKQRKILLTVTVLYTLLVLYFMFLLSAEERLRIILSTPLFSCLKTSF